MNKPVKLKPAPAPASRLHDAGEVSGWLPALLPAKLMYEEPL